MTDVKPGDRVTHEGEERVVVDVTGDGMAILRRPEDEKGEDLVAVKVDDL